MPVGGSYAMKLFGSVTLLQTATDPRTEPHQIGPEELQSGLPSRTRTTAGRDLTTAVPCTGTEVETSSVKQFVVWAQPGPTVRMAITVLFVSPAPKEKHYIKQLRVEGLGHRQGLCMITLTRISISWESKNIL